MDEFIFFAVFVSGNIINNFSEAPFLHGGNFSGGEGSPGSFLYGIFNEIFFGIEKCRDCFRLVKVIIFASSKNYLLLLAILKISLISAQGICVSLKSRLVGSSATTVNTSCIKCSLWSVLPNSSHSFLYPL